MRRHGAMGNPSTCIQNVMAFLSVYYQVLITIFLYTCTCISEPEQISGMNRTQTTITTTATITTSTFVLLLLLLLHVYMYITFFLTKLFYQREAQYGLSILRPPIQPENNLKFEVVLKWRDSFAENIIVVSLMVGLKIEGIVK